MPGAIMPVLPRSLRRIPLYCAIVLLLIVGVVLARFYAWRSEALSRLSRMSRVIETSAGKVEFEIRGEGPAVLVFHGAPGGYDQAMLLGRGLLSSGFQVLAPSRPGYLRTPLATGVSPASQADAMKGLLDALGLKSVAVLAAGEGAPAAIEFSRRYPDRVWALVLVSAVTKQYVRWLRKPLAPRIADETIERLTGDIGAWFFTQTALHEPLSALRWTFKVDSAAGAMTREKRIEYVLDHPAQLDWFRGLADTFAPLGPREIGTRNDMAQLQVSTDFKFKKLRVPTLFVHGTDDIDLPIADTRATADLVPGGELYEVEGGGHIVFLGPGGDGAEHRIEEFLKEHSPAPALP